MKNLIVLLLITFLFQSCYSYHNISSVTNNLRTGDVYKIKQNGKYRKAKIISSNDTLVKATIKNKEEIVKISDIEKIKKREFSRAKTIALVYPVVLIGTGLIVFKDLHLPLGN
jgi:hypothetical protein